MPDLCVQRVLTGYVRRNAPDTYRQESKALRDHYGCKLLGIGDDFERYLIGQAYRQHKAALVIAWLA